MIPACRVANTLEEARAKLAILKGLKAQKPKVPKLYALTFHDSM